MDRNERVSKTPIRLKSSPAKKYKLRDMLTIGVNYIRKQELAVCEAKLAEYNNVSEGKINIDQVMFLISLDMLDDVIMKLGLRENVRIQALKPQRKMRYTTTLQRMSSRLEAQNFTNVPWGWLDELPKAYPKGWAITRTIGVPLPQFSLVWVCGAGGPLCEFVKGKLAIV